MALAPKVGSADRVALHMTNLYSLPDFAAALSGAFKPVAENIKRGFSEQAESRKEREAKKRKTEAEIDRGRSNRLPSGKRHAP